MENLPKTQQAIHELRTDRRIMFGLHESSQVKVGVPGRIVAEIPFDPAVHDPLSVNPLSIWEDIVGEPHVQQVIPQRPLRANIVIHQDSAEDLAQSWLAPVQKNKASLAEELGQLLVASRMPGDRVRTHRIESGPAQEVAEEVADIAKSGLTFVISSFNRLRLLKPVKPANSSGLVAIKVNHQLERELPAGVGCFSVGGLKEVNTNKPRELAGANQELVSKHEAIVGRLGEAGAAVASVVFDSRREHEANMAQADQAIARAVYQLR